MSLPPVTVHIKRKATDEPVDFLRVHEPHGKRQRRAIDFVFSRQPIPETDNLSVAQPLPPTSRPIKQIHKASSSASLSTQHKLQNPQYKPLQSPNAAQPEASFPQTSQASDSLLENELIEADEEARRVPQLSVQDSVVRRFHMSRSSRSLDPLAPLPGGQIRKRKAPNQPAIFMECKTRVADSSTHKAPLEGKTHLITPGQPLHQPKPERRQKKPGLAVIGSAVSKKDGVVHKPSKPLVPPQSTTPMRLPSGIMMPWDVNSEQLAAEMQAYTLQEIGKNIAEAENFQSKPQSPVPKAKSRGPQSRFKPKKPPLRYMERHPDAAMDTVQIASMEADQPLSGDDMSDESDYIIDTYVRMPAHTLESSSNQKNIGFLVLDSQPDIDDFYMDEWESDEEVQDEEDDENAEDHYAADYPDDEVESDDEFGRDPYSYRTRNASDLEEFDEDDATFSDDDEDSTKHPWMKQSF